MREKKFKVEAWCDQLPVQCFIALCSTGCVLWQWCMESNTHYMHSSPYYKFNVKLNPAESFGWNPSFENGLNTNLSYSVFLLESTVLLQFFLTNLFTLPSIALLAEQRRSLNRQSYPSSGWSLHLLEQHGLDFYTSNDFFRIQSFFNTRWTRIVPKLCFMNCIIFICHMYSVLPVTWCTHIFNIYLTFLIWLTNICYPLFS